MTEAWHIASISVIELGGWKDIRRYKKQSISTMKTNRKLLIDAAIILEKIYFFCMSFLIG